MMGAIGTGNVRRGRLTMSLGSSGTLYGHADAPVIDPKGQIAAFCGSTGGWLPLLCTMNCTVATELMRKPLGVAVADIDEAIAPIAPGADGLLLLPFFNGERTPDLPRGKGCLVGLDARNTSRGHLLRATVEGATFALKFGIDELKSLGLAAGEIVLTGGGALSRVWRQIVADVAGLPVVILAENEGAAFGAALQALWSLERRDDPALDIGAITDRHVRVDAAAAVRPDPGHVAAYAVAYRNYLRALDQVSPLFNQQSRV
jgi:xylulokinase